VCEADENYQSPSLPPAVQYLHHEGLNLAFITYMSGWKGLAAEKAA